MIELESLVLYTLLCWGTLEGTAVVAEFINKALKSVLHDD